MAETSETSFVIRPDMRTKLVAYVAGAASITLSAGMIALYASQFAGSAVTARNASQEIDMTPTGAISRPIVLNPCTGRRESP